MTKLFLAIIALLLGAASIAHLVLAIKQKEWPRIQERTEHSKTEDMASLVITTILALWAILSLTQQAGCG